MQKGLTLSVAAVAIAAGAFVGVSVQAEDAPRAAVGDPAPDFTLTDTAGEEHTLSDYTSEDEIVVLEWFNPDCPYVVKHHEKLSTFEDMHAKYADQDVVWLAINSNAEGKQGAGLRRNLRAIEEFGIDYPLLLDAEGQRVSRAYGARTTPQMFVIDSDGYLVYDGALDDNASARGQAGDVNYVEEALDAILAGEEVATPETRPYGCNVKYSG